MKNAAVGLRPHSGWTALVAVSLEKGEPVVLCRRRVELVKTFTYTFRQPYHTAAKMPLEDGRKFIAETRSEASRLAYKAFREMCEELEKVQYCVVACGLLLASGRALPPLEQILASHPLIHTADGELFREALADGSERNGWNILRLREKELLPQAARDLEVKEAALLKKVTELGRSMGPPWSQDEKFATLAAWLALRQGSTKASKRAAKSA